MIDLLSTGSSPTDTLRGDVVLTPLDPKDGAPIANESFVFQYFPESVTDNKAINWQNKELSGASIPLYGWTSSGERTVSFQAYFTSDIDYLAQGRRGMQELADRVKFSGVQRMNVDVRTPLAILRSYTLPTYTTSAASDSPLTQPPRKLRLDIPGSGIGILGGSQDGMVLQPDSIVCFMNECQITFQSFFPSGIPRIAEVSLGFTQIGQTGNTVYFPQACTREALESIFLPYSLAARRKGGY